MRRKNAAHFSAASLARGFTLVELLVYLASMAIVLVALAYMMVNAYDLYRATLLSARADRAAGTLMQVLATELRSGAAINQSDSVFNSAFGRLAIRAQSGAVETDKVFRLENGRVIFSAAGADTAMTPADMQASKLLFTRILTPVSYAVRYELDITFSVRGRLVTKTYPGVVILRNSYE